MTITLSIPESLKPEDGRFGSGPSKIRPEQIAALDAGATTLLGTSHRQAPVKQLVASIREGLREFFHLPEGYEVALGNGGASAFWEIACASLITRRAAFGTYGSFSAKFAASAANAPFLEDPVLFPGEPGTYRLPELTEGVDTYCWAHNETSTGVAAPIRRVAGSREAGALTVIDGTPQRALCLWTSARPTSTTSHRRRPSVPMAVCGSPSSPPKLSIVRQASNQALIWKAHIAGCRRSSR